MDNAEFTTTPDVQPITLVRFTIADLGFPNGCTTTQLFARRKELGLEFCPAATGPHYRLQYLDQPDGEYLSIGMKPITGSDGNPLVFDLNRNGDQLKLHACRANPDDPWRPGNEIAFRLSKVETLAA